MPSRKNVSCLVKIGGFSCVIRWFSGVIFAPGSRPGARRPQRADLPWERRGTRFTQSRDDEDIITERLKGLGYI